MCAGPVGCPSTLKLVIVLQVWTGDSGWCPVLICSCTILLPAFIIANSEHCSGRHDPCHWLHERDYAGGTSAYKAGSPAFIPPVPVKIQSPNEAALLET